MPRNPLLNIMLNDSTDDQLEMIPILAVMEEERLQREGGSSSQHGSVKPRRFVDHDILQGHKNLFQNYFADSPIYNVNLLRRRFRMRRSLFLHIQSKIEAHDPYFVQKRNCARKLGLSSLQKITVAFRILAYGVAANFMDEYLKIGESIALESLKKFVKAMMAIFSDEYLRSPNNNGIVRLLAVGERRRFPGMLGSIDCMHWTWKSCPTAWKGMYTGHNHDSKIVLEAVASNDLWIWHAFFGLPGSHNNINVLERSSVFSELVEGHAPPCNYSINDHNYTMGYYLADGIYPSWATFVKTIPSSQGNKRKYFAQQQELARKDVVRVFGVLQARFAIVRQATRFWKRETLKDIMKACIILHNMIVEDEKDVNGLEDFDYDTCNHRYPPELVSFAHTIELMEFIQNYHRIRDQEIHSQLQSDLVEHLWQLHGQ